MSSHGIPQVAGRERDPEKERQKIHDYQQLVAQVTEQIKSNNLSQETLVLISKLLSKNPEYYTVWNYRRLVLENLLKESSGSDIIPNDLRFLVPLLVQFPKCYWIWNYRMWLLGQVERHMNAPEVLVIWHEELGLVSKMLSRDERNFHGWDYRRYVVSNIERLQADEGKTMVESEFEYTTKMVRKALQNFSALHYRSRLIPRLLNERNSSPAERRKFFESELDLIQDVLVDPYNSAAWFYHDLLLQTLSPSCPEVARIIQDVSKSDIDRYYTQEIERILEMLEDFDDCKWIFQALIQYTTRLEQEIRGKLPSNESQRKEWVQMLIKLDPMRLGHWTERGKEVKPFH